MPIAELILSSVLKMLLTQLGSTLLDQYARINGISDKLTKWQGLLLMIQAVMDSAEDKQIKGDPAVDLWLADLREVAYDMEDLLDEISVDARRNPPKVQTRSPQLPSCLISCCSKINPRTLLSDYHLANEIEEVDHRLDQVFQRKDLLGITQNFKTQSPSSSDKPLFTTTSLPEPKFVGREKPIEELLARLVGSDSADHSVRAFTVVSIVGMGGLGKTTLAQQLYNHESVREAFTLRAWTCVSDAFDSFAITRNILQSVNPSVSYDRKDLNWVQNSLKEQLSGKKFLIVLDDVWNDNYCELEYFLKPFYSGRRGSRVLLTTRNLEVAKRAGDRDPRALDLLSTGECLSLLAYHATGEASFEHQAHLQEVAFRLAEKCKGLPLAAKTIGGLLLFESDYEKWKHVLDHDIWETEDKGHKIPPALKLSYIHLPVHLKKCFAACAIFPKDQLFDRDELIHLWIVQSVLEKGSEKTYRDVGIKYFGQLVARSLLQKTDDKESRYFMHDLINDLAKSVVGEAYYSSDEYKGPSHGWSLGKVRHAAFVAKHLDSCVASKVEVYRSMKKLRAFIPFVRDSSTPIVYISYKVIHDLIIDLKYLRVLSLRYLWMRKVPDHIGKLQFLRSIDLSYTEFEELPESICDLVTLESLLLQGCKFLMKLPRNIHKLIKLIHLDITGADKLVEMPPHISRLTNLETLSNFVVTKGTDQRLKELGPLKCLGGKLQISNLLVVDEVGDAVVANLCEKEGISYISYDWGAGDEGISRDDEHQLKLLDNLQPPIKIEGFKISGYVGKEFSSWLGNSGMNNVTVITLKDCKRVESLPPLGKLPSLKSLEISDLLALSRIGGEFYGTEKSFQSLLSLSFYDMPAWEEWSSRGDYPENDQPFPCLHKLEMKRCPLLKKGLPGRLDTLSELVIEDCPLLETQGDTLSLPSLREMHIHRCNEAFLKSLVDVSSMIKMSIWRVPELVHFNQNFSTSWVSLEEIQIVGCPRFETFVDGNCVKQVLPKLKVLEIASCHNLEKLPDDLDCLPSLNGFGIFDCRRLSAFPSMGLPPTLSKLQLSRCPPLPTSEFLSTRLPMALEELVLNDLEGLTSVTDLFLGAHCSQFLRHLFIVGCTSLTTISDCLRNLSSLSGLQVSDCPVLELDCFPDLPCSISWFIVNGCPKLRSLPHNMGNLTSLKQLQVENCAGITCFPRGGFPPSLAFLQVENCKKLNQPLEEWCLSGLGALRELFILGEMECLDEMACFPSSADGSLAWSGVFPSSLVWLEIKGMKKAERVAGGLRNHLTSLEVFTILNCEKMRYLPEEGFPDCFERIWIVGCPLLKERYRDLEDCPLFQLIPFVYFP